VCMQVTPVRGGVTSSRPLLSSKRRPHFITRKSLGKNKNIFMCKSDCRRGLGWRLDFLTTLTHDSRLHLIITPSLISTLYKSLQHTLNIFSLLWSSPVVPWQPLLTVEILQLPRSHSCQLGSQLHLLSLLFRVSHTTDYSSAGVFVI
jgi:hypothetical protein